LPEPRLLLSELPLSQLCRRFIGLPPLHSFAQLGEITRSPKEQAALLGHLCMGRGEITADFPLAVLQPVSATASRIATVRGVNRRWPPVSR
jgi:hypothetical protein